MQSLITNIIKEICIIFNSQIKLLLKLGVDQRQSNLPTIQKMIIIILDKYN